MATVTSLPPVVDLSEVDVDALIAELEGRGRSVNTNGSGETRTTFDDDMKATIVVESRAIGPGNTAKKYGIPSEQIYVWRKRELADPAFKLLTTQKNSQYRDDWRTQSAAAIRSLLDYIRRAGETMDTEDPKNVRAIAGALKMVGEFGLAVDITYSKLGKVLDAPALAAPATKEVEGYVLEAAEGIIEGDFADLKELQE